MQEQKTLKEIRTQILKLSQEKMARILDVSVYCWHTKECYKRPLKATELITIAQMANLDPREVKIT